MHAAAYMTISVDLTLRIVRVGQESGPNLIVHLGFFYWLSEWTQFCGSRKTVMYSYVRSTQLTVFWNVERRKHRKIMASDVYFTARKIAFIQIGRFVWGSVYNHEKWSRTTFHENKRHTESNLFRWSHLGLFILSWRRRNRKWISLCEI